MASLKVLLPGIGRSGMIPATGSVGPDRDEPPLGYWPFLAAVFLRATRPQMPLPGARLLAIIQPSGHVSGRWDCR